MHQPTTEILRYLSGGFDAHVITRFDVALDLVTRTFGEAEALHNYIERRLVQPRRSPSGVKRFKSTVYYARASARNNIVIYSDKPSKIDGRPCCHIEWRIGRGAAVRAAGVDSAADIVALDHRAFWAKRLVLRDLPAGGMLTRLGRQLRGNSAGKSRPRKVRLGSGVYYDRDAAVASVWLRATATAEVGWTVQEALDQRGTQWAKYFPRLPISWMLPGASA
jgi:hypothetical protein